MVSRTGAVPIIAQLMLAHGGTRCNRPLKPWAKRVLQEHSVFHVCKSLVPAMAPVKMWQRAIILVHRNNKAKE